MKVAAADLGEQSRRHDEATDGRRNIDILAPALLVAAEELPKPLGDGRFKVRCQALGAEFAPEATCLDSQWPLVRLFGFNCLPFDLIAANIRYWLARVLITFASRWARHPTSVEHDDWTPFGCYRRERRACNCRVSESGW